MKTLDLNRIKRTIKNFNKASVLVVGDLMLDEFVWGKVSRISPEAPVPVVWTTSESVMPGGASNVAHNIKALGGTVYLSGVVGNDSRGALLVDELEKRGVNASGVVRDQERPTTLKTRVIAHNQQVVRIDKEKVDNISPDSIDRMLEYASGIIKDIDAVVIEDYGKGVIVPRFVEKLIRLARRHKKIVTVDPKENHFRLYRNATCITPNLYEAARAVGLVSRDDLPVEDIGGHLIKQLNSDVLLITLGEEGMCVFEKGAKPTRIPTMAQDVYDVSGAGDTVISTYTLAVVSGAKNIEAAHIANCAAGIVVGKVGIAVATQKELIEKIKKEVKRVR